MSIKISTIDAKGPSPIAARAGSDRVRVTISPANNAENMTAGILYIKSRPDIIVNIHDIEKLMASISGKVIVFVSIDVTASKNIVIKGNIKMANSARLIILLRGILPESLVVANSFRMQRSSIVFINKANLRRKFVPSLYIDKMSFLFFKASPLAISIIWFPKDVKLVF